MGCPNCGADIRFQSYRNFSQGPNIIIDKTCECNITLTLEYVDAKYVKINGLIAKLWY